MGRNFISFIVKAYCLYACMTADDRQAVRYMLFSWDVWTENLHISYFIAGNIIIHQFLHSTFFVFQLKARAWQTVDGQTDKTN